jgi:hypothetical protein
MRHIINKIVLATSLLFLAASCDNSDYEFDNLIPEWHHRVASIQDAPDGEVKLYDIDVESEMTFSVLRTGSDPFLAASVGLESMTQEELTTYNSQYMLVDPSYYTVEHTLSFDSGEAYKKVSAVFTAESVRKLKAQIATLEEGMSYCVALKISDIGNCSVYADKSYILRKVVITKPKLEITGSVESIESNPAAIDAAAYPEIELTLNMDTDNIWDFDCRVEYNPALVDQYNAKYGTSYQKLSADNVEIENADVTFVSGENAGQSIAKLKMKNPSSLGKYLIPIEVKHDIFIGDTYYLILDDEIHLREDMLSAPFHVSYDGQGLKGLIDDDPKTFWHTPYKDPYYYDKEYGHWFQIKFDRKLDHQMRIKYGTRNEPRTMPWTIQLWASTDDGITWESVAYLDNDKGAGLPGRNASWESSVFDFPSKGVTNLRFCVLRIENKGNRDNNREMCGVYFNNGNSPACTGLIEFKIWAR